MTKQGSFYLSACMQGSGNGSNKMLWPSCTIPKCTTHEEGGSPNSSKGFPLTCTSRMLERLGYLTQGYIACSTFAWESDHLTKNYGYENLTWGPDCLTRALRLLSPKLT